MPKAWNSRAKPPKGTDEFIRWLAEDMALFQRERPDLPQGQVLKARDRNKVARAWNAAREEAEAEDAGKVSPEWQEAVRKFHRTRTLTLPLKKKKPRKTRVTRVIQKRGA